jgi:hypothetical protein
MAHCCESAGKPIKCRPFSFDNLMSRIPYIVVNRGDSVIGKIFTPIIAKS